MTAVAALILDEHTEASVRAHIIYPDRHDVLVTYQACERTPWTCSEHGAMYGPACSHTSATEYAVRAHDLLNPDGRNTP